MHRHELFLIALLALAGLSGGCHRPPDADGRTHIEMAAYYGGFGDKWYREIVKKYEETQGGRIKVDFWSSPRLNIKLQPRVLQRKPPELTEATMPHWLLIKSGQYVAYNELLDGPAWGATEGRWRDTFFPGVLDAFKDQGNVYGVPLSFGIWVMWYDRKMFREQGWEVPETWAEFLELCDTIKKTGIAPLAFQGLEPGYAWPTLTTLFERIAGLEKYADLQNLKPGIFVDEDFIRAARITQELSRDYFQEACWGMDHGIAQLQFVKGKTAMVACGVWLKNEMEGNIPEDFELDSFIFPSIDGKVENAKVQLSTTGGYFFVYRESRHPEIAQDLVRFMTDADNMRDYMLSSGTLPTVAAALEGVEPLEGFEGVFEAVNASTFFTWDRITWFYLDITHQVMPVALRQLLTCEITPEEFCRKMEEAAEAVRENAEIFKPPDVSYGRGKESAD